MIPLVNPALARKGTAIQPWLGGAVRWVVVVLALVATADAGYLTWKSFTQGSVAGCDGTGAVDCDDVLGSRWSRAAGMPVALGGLLCYGTILGLSIFAGSRSFNENGWLGTVLAAVAFLALFAGLWFTGLQFIALGKFCYYCLAIHMCGLITALLVLWAAIANRPKQMGGSLSHSAVTAAIPGARRTAGPRSAERPFLAAAAPIAAIAVAGLIAVQVMFPTKMYQVSTPDLAATVDMTAAADTADQAEDDLSPRAREHVVNRVSDDTAGDTTDASDEQAPRRDDEVQLASAEEEVEKDDAPELSREVTFLKGRLKIDMYDEAVLGSPDAEHVVLEMMDYTCPHCRKMHEHIRDARYRYGDQLAVVILPMPLELECNKKLNATDPIHRGSCKISRTALAVAKADPRKFIDFHNFLLQDEEKPPTSSQAVMRAYQIVGSKKYSEVARSKEFDERIQRYIRLFSALTAQERGKRESFGLPVQIVGDTVLSGGDMTDDEMFEAWEKAIDIKPL
jgi:uncharacterized membrane protein